MIPVTRSSMPEFEDYINEIRDLWESRWLTNMGEKHKKFQSCLKQYLGVKNIELLTNGHMALELSLQALKLHGEVITTPFTFASTTHAIVRNGLEPVFCDINPDDYTIDADMVESLVSDRTCAILPVHVYGNVCNIEKIEEIAKKYGLKVIYDAAHAFGIRYRGIGIGNYGDVSCFSFHATKVFHSIEGGAASFKNLDFGAELYRLKNFGIRDQENVDGIGANAKMNEFCAAMGICNLKIVDGEIEKRKKVTECYHSYLEGIDGIKLCGAQENVRCNYSYFPVLFDEKVFGSSRNEVFEELQKNGIYPRKYFYPITSGFECYHGRFDANSTPTALYVSKRVLTLPMYSDLPLEEVGRICEIILKCKKL